MTPLRFVSLAVWTLSAVHSVTSIPRLAGFSPRLALALNSRQSGLPAVPPQCVSTCEPVNTILETNVRRLGVQPGSVTYLRSLVHRQSVVPNRSSRNTSAA
jgi:hypothetical protein